MKDCKVLFCYYWQHVPMSYEIESVLYMYFEILVDRIQSRSKSRQPVMKLHVGLQRINEEICVEIQYLRFGKCLDKGTLLAANLVAR